MEALFIRIPSPLQLVSLSFAFELLLTATNNLLYYSSIILPLLLFGFTSYKLILYPFFLSPLRHIPQPPGFRPLVGHIFALISQSPGEPHLRIIQDTPNDGLVHTFGLFHADRLILTNPTSLADVLVHKSYDFEKPPKISRVLKRLIGNGLLMAEGDQHKYHRKLMMSAFHFRRIRNLYNTFWNKSLEFCTAARTIMEESNSHGVDISPLCTQVTLDIIGLAVIGRDLGSLRNKQNHLVKNFEAFLQPTAEKAAYFRSHIILPSWFIAMLPWKMHGIIDETASNLHKICTDFVSEKRCQIADQNQESDDILSHLIQNSGLSNKCIVDHILTLFTVGHESTSSALAWTAHLLSVNQEAQLRLRAEIYKAIPNPKSLLEPESQIGTILENLPYLNSVCNEALRLFPTLPLTARVAIRDTMIANQFVPATTLILISPWAINRSHQLWGEEADRFIPERWIDQETGRMAMCNGVGSKYSFLTFFHGPRSCIGERFARAELRCLITAFVGNFSMQMADPGEVVRVGGSLSAKPVNGMRLKLMPMTWGA